MEIPSGADFGHVVLAMRVIGLGTFGVSESAAADGVDANEQNKHDYVENRELVPIVSHTFEHTGFARVALVAKKVRGVVPPVAVRVLGHHGCPVIARCWWLAATRLKDNFAKVI